MMSINGAQSFRTGYEEVKLGNVTQELTPHEIAVTYPSYRVDEFRQGMLDGLAGDDYRYQWTVTGIQPGLVTEP